MAGPFQVPLDRLRRQVNAARWLLNETRPGVPGRTAIELKAPLEAAVLLMAAAWEGFIETLATRAIDELHTQGDARFAESWQSTSAKDQIESRQANNPNGTRTRWLLWQHFGFDPGPNLGLTVRRRTWTDGAWFHDRAVSANDVIQMMDGFYVLRNNIMHGSAYWPTSKPATKKKRPPTGVLARGYRTTAVGRAASGEWRLQDWCAYNCVDVFSHVGEVIAAGLPVHLGLQAPA